MNTSRAPDSAPEQWRARELRGEDERDGALARTTGAFVGVAASHTAHAFQFDAVGFSYANGNMGVRGLNLRIGAGQFRFVTGESGSGKTTVLRLMGLDVAPTGGRLSILGEDVTVLPRRVRASMRRRIGIVFQDLKLIDDLSALDNVALPLRINGSAEPSIEPRVRELLTWLGLKEEMAAQPSSLTIGQQQLVAIARAVISRPEILLVDEPTAKLEERVGIRVMHLFAELHRLGATVIVATTNMAIVRRFKHPRFHLVRGTLCADV